MTNQEAFDKMMNHLRSLKGRSVNKDGFCVYNGLKCPVGVLMTDEEQEQFGDFKGSVDHLLEEMWSNGHESMLHGLNFALLSYTQALHDDGGYWDARGFAAEESAKKIAIQFGLTYNKP